MGELVLYRSERTQVYRRNVADGHGTVICKRASGPGAVRRIGHEQAVLRRLAGLPGVPRLAARQGRQTLIVEDDGAVPLAAGRVSVPRLWKIARELAATLAAVHRAGVIHRDITPANVVLAGERPLLIDYDLAVIGPAEPGEAGEPIGTLGFLAPEQTGRIGPAADHRADLYSLGATLYALAVGEPPVIGTDPLDLIRDTLVRPPVPPAERRPDLPARLSDIIMRLLEKSLERRYQSAEGLAHDLAHPESGRPLGERDFPAFLAPPDDLIGRGPELRTLRAALDRATLTGSPALLVSGPPGIGKSALAHSLRPVITEQGGWFAAGRFDQFRTGTDTGGITRALRVLTRLVLAESEEEVAEDRRRLIAGLGPNATVACAVIPEMADLIGPHPPPEPVDPVAARTRVTATAVALLRAMTSRHRIVLVLDDVQWASGGSLHVLDTIVNAGPLPGLLLVVCYRDEHPPLRALCERWQRDGGAEAVLRVGGLDRDGVAELAGAVLRMPALEASGLAALVGAGGGNPYATVELLNALRAEGLLRLDGDGWRWDPEAVRDFVAGHQLPRLLAARLEQQPACTREPLTAMACLGGEVTIALLAAATGTPETALAPHLTRAVTDGLILISGGTVRFRHDLVHEAARDTLPEDERRRGQLAMARRLAAHPGHRQETAEQYLAAAALVEDAGERRTAAELLHTAARRTIQLTNYPVAADLLDAAERLLEPVHGDPDPLWDAIAVDRHATLYCLGRIGEAERIYDDLTRRSPELLTLAAATAIQINIVAQRGESRTAYALGLGVLRRFGIEPPDDLGAAVRREITDLRDCVDELDRAPETTDPRVLAAGRLINRLLVPAYQLGPLPHSWTVLQAYRLWRREGVCAPVVGAAGSAICATISQLDDYRTGYRLSRYALDAGRAHGYQAETAIARYMHLFLAAHWFEPLEALAEAGQQAREDLLAAGDVQVAGLLSARLASVVLETADSLETTAEEIATGLALAERTGNRIAEFSLATYRELVRALRDGTFDEAALPEGLRGYPPSMASYHVNKAIAALVLDDPDALDEHSLGAMAGCEAIRGFYVSALARVVRCLSLTARSRAPGSTRTEELDELRDWLARRATDAPHNFGHLLHLVDAESAWARGDPDAAARHFDAGLHGATARPWHRAVLAERAGLFHLDRGLTHTGRLLLAEARETYRVWGADAAVSRLESRHPFLRSSLTSESGSGAGADRIDLTAILRATRALSQATSLAGLETQVGEVLSAMTGATHVRLAMRHRDGEWHVTGPGGAPLLSAVRYVRRTRKPLLVADATRDDRFARDPYLAGLDTCALLAVPLPSRDVDGAVLLLENHRQGGVFTIDRLETVRLIAGQLAVSLDNALLYDSLEDTVRARTADLAAANQLKADLIGMLGHEINNPLGTILGNLDLALTEDDLPGPARETLVTVQRTTQRLATIVQEVLDLVSLDAGRLTAAPTPVRVAGHIEAALAAASSLGTPVTCPPDLEALVQPGHLDQILTNLISNAAKYGGGATAVVARKESTTVTIEVRDEGPGVPPEFRDRLFDRFARAEPTAGKVPGTGLGLYIVRELARANHGDVHYRAAVGGGSSFVLSLMQPQGGGSRQGGVRAKEGLV